jgi:hypothetical protein
MQLWRKIGMVQAILIALGTPLAPVFAGERPAVIELFTSQGCSSCPPADELMGQLSKNRGDVIILSLPVDIWDYNGWKDTLARPEFTVRQKNYSQSRGDHQVYTPQIVVDGQSHGVGSDRSQVMSLMQETSALRQAQSAPLDVHETNGMLIVDVGEGSGDLGRGASVWLMRVAKSRTVTVGRGENRGREITYTNVVRSMVRLGFWNGAAARFEMPLPEARADDADGYVVIVQKSWGDRLGPILAASKSSAL